ncbi:MAG: Flagellar biosynthetic protein FliQ [Thermocaproicibacter melissae]|jgi:flagellar biosynthesis protein FliQ|uniref:flagellar biosynthesis protein FliQ n=1 Tax=Thermocaproicibacter melissae TaxID=2966552 RepID=UPI0024B0B062|nr:flagellar biosynthesis protein FliQ [Thermocaproicibacter melissae]WBY64328.1 flagellar biosynthesis protein FliQ [Thermocaproicibacter melissae]
MSVAQVTQIVQAALIAMLKVSAPVLLISMAVGLVVSILQAATQIHEQSVAFVPKLVAIAVILVIMGAWMLGNLKDFTLYIFDQIVNLS